MADHLPVGVLAAQEIVGMELEKSQSGEGSFRR